MKCPYLIRTFGYTCFAGERPYSPSEIQIERYCRSKESTRCPFVRAPLTDRHQDRPGARENTHAASLGKKNVYFRIVADQTPRPPGAVNKRLAGSS